MIRTAAIIATTIAALQCVRTRLKEPEALGPIVDAQIRVLQEGHTDAELETDFADARGEVQRAVEKAAEWRRGDYGEDDNFADYWEDHATPKAEKDDKQEDPKREDVGSGQQPPVSESGSTASQPSTTSPSDPNAATSPGASSGGEGAPSSQPAGSDVPPEGGNSGDGQK